MQPRLLFWVVYIYKHQCQGILWWWLVYGYADAEAKLSTGFASMNNICDAWRLYLFSALLFFFMKWHHKGKGAWYTTYVKLVPFYSVWQSRTVGKKKFTMIKSRVDFQNKNEKNFSSESLNFEKFASLVGLKGHFYPFILLYLCPRRTLIVAFSPFRLVGFVWGNKGWVHENTRAMSGINESS